MNDIVNDVLTVFPERLKRAAELAARISPAISEIRLIADKAMFFYTDAGIRFVEKSGYISSLLTAERIIPLGCELEELTDRAAGYSGYLYENELSEGFITYGRAFRIGICAEKNSIHAGRITSLSIRIPCFRDNAFPENTLREIVSFNKGLLIAGAPGSGKTTLLRNVAKGLSDGMLGEYKKVCVVDERGELASDMSCGICTDVISGMKKSEAIMRAVRLMSPHYIICDEIGAQEETKSVLEGLNSGVRFAASVHARDIDELVRRRQFRILFDEYVFDKIVLLSPVQPGYIKRILNCGDVANEIDRTCGAVSCCQP